MASSGGTRRRAAQGHRFARLGLVVVLGGLLAALVATNVGLRSDTDRALASATEARLELAEAHDRIAELDVERDRIADRRQAAEHALDAALERLETLAADEDRLQRLLAEQSDEYQAAETRLDIVAASVDDAAAQTATNDALLTALDRCLDGATEATNALSVGDVVRAFAAVEAVRDDCRTVGVALG